MSNYHNMEFEFIERTVKLLAQYEAIMPKLAFEEQFNHTLAINCLLGLVVMPKERVLTYVPKKRLTQDFKNKMGVGGSEFCSEIQTLTDLIRELRHSVAHFDIRAISGDGRFHIDLIEFRDTQDADKVIARIPSGELLPFLRYYSSILLSNLKKNRRR